MGLDTGLGAQKRVNPTDRDFAEGIDQFALRVLDGLERHVALVIGLKVNGVESVAVCIESGATHAEAGDAADGLAHELRQNRAGGAGGGHVFQIEVDPDSVPPITDTEATIPTVMGPICFHVPAAAVGKCYLPLVGDFQPAHGALGIQAMDGVRSPRRSAR